MRILGSGRKEHCGMELMMHLNFLGQCEEAFKFYEKTFGGKDLMMTKWGASPMAAQAPQGWGDKIMHASMLVGPTRLMGADSPPERYEKAQGFAAVFETKDAAEAERAYKALAENAQKVIMPLQETFWATRYGMVVDRFGIPWMVNCGKSM
jgi:PhnB protein